jgi:dihydroflavonol-4-reductase
MRALVTGAGGFIGRHVASTLVDAGADVVAFDRRFPQGQVTAALADVAELVEGDVLDPDSVRRAVSGCDAVFHLAAVYSYKRSDAGLMRSVNVEGTRTVLEAAAVGRRRRVVHTSSCATCGPVPGRAANEGDTPAAGELTIPYKRTKLDGERLALAAARTGADVLVVNPTVPVGPGDLRPTPTGKMVADVAHGRVRAYLARSALNVVAVEDVAAGHVRAFEHGRAGERYLLGGENLSIREVFAVIAAAAGRPAPRIGIPWTAAYAAARLADAAMRPLGREPRMLLLDEVRSGRLPHLFDDSKARSELGHVSRPAAQALTHAAGSVLASGPDHGSFSY